MSMRKRSSSWLSRTILVGASAFALAAVAAVFLPSSARAADRLEVVAESHEMIWNAVAVSGGKVFVAGPRWTGSKGPALGQVTAKGTIAPYPSAAWNAWKEGDDPSKAFVNLNAIHLDDHGGLWAVDTGSPTFGGDPLPGGAKLVRISLATGVVDRVITFPATVALPGSYVDDVRFNGDHAYLTDAGRPGIIVLDMRTGTSRRVLDGHPGLTAPQDRTIVLDGQVVRTPDGAPLRVNSDPFELSPDRRWLYAAPLSGPWSRIPTALLDDPKASPMDLVAAVEPWADLPPTGGTAMAPNGDLYFTDLATNAIRKRAADGTISLVVQDDRLHWVDAPFLDETGALWLPTPQMDRVALFQGGSSRTQWPIRLYRIAPSN